MLYILPFYVERRYFDAISLEEQIHVYVPSKYLKDYFDILINSKPSNVLLCQRNYYFDKIKIRYNVKGHKFEKILHIVKPRGRFRIRKRTITTFRNDLLRYFKFKIYKRNNTFRVYQVLSYLKSPRKALEFEDRNLPHFILEQSIRRYYIIRQRYILFDLKELVNAYIQFDNIVLFLRIF